MRLKLAAVALLLNVVLIATPGYFSHDELDHGTVAVRRSLSQIEWPRWFAFGGFHYRPLTFTLWLFASHYLFEVPRAMHALVVVLHVVNALLVYELVLRSTTRNVAIASCLIFSAFPTAAVTVGWVATMADELFVSFTLLALLIALANPRGARYGAFLVCCVLGFMSKEHFIVLPAVLVVLALLRRRAQEPVLVAIAGALSALYLVLRAGGLASHPTASYTPAWSNLPGNLLVYFVYPFDWRHFEAVHTIPSQFQPWTALIVPALLQLALIGVLARRAGVRVALLGSALFIVLLAPVLLIGGVYGHYLYATTPLFAVALGWLLVGQRARWGRLVAVALLGVGLLHSANIQLSYYRTGVIQTRMLSSFYSALKSVAPGDRGRPIVVINRVENHYILQRALHGMTYLRDLELAEGQISVAFSENDPVPPEALIFRALESGDIVRE
jgi:hypothetical protein